jgi:hypothetical protein
MKETLKIWQIMFMQIEWEMVMNHQGMVIVIEVEE